MTETTTPNLVELEKAILKFWQDNQCFKLLVEKNKNYPVFHFLDGPITANNPMGVHHARGRTLKDLFLRYKAMRGFRSHWRNGFDSQGLWVEVEVERALGFNSKQDIEKYSVERFVRACQERVRHYSAIQTAQSIRLGQWMDWDNSYFTHTDQNIEGIWFFLKRCHEHGWIRQASWPMSWCPRCGTSLSEHEMAGSYQDLEHSDVLAKLPIEGLEARILVWTTTPWTLTSNVALAVRPDTEYVEAEVAGLDRPLILARASLENIQDLRPVVRRTLKGAELVGRRYETFFPEFKAQQGIDHHIVAWDLVDPAEGTGVVHIAPGCGPDDYELGLKENLPQIAPVDQFGVFYSDFGWLAGQSIASAGEAIIERLAKTGKLVGTKRIVHSYPVCWRCKTETIFRLDKEWLIRTDEIRPRLIEAATKVEWDPPYVGKLMEDWLRNMGDWNISRRRYYGMPLPFYPCGCGELTVVGSRRELRELAGPEVDDLPELHLPWIDQVRIACPKCGRKVTRATQVGDVWLDAGIVPYTTLGYFENRQRWEEYFPAEWVTEMSEQVRLWFYSMLFMSVTLEGRAPYEKVLAYESVVAEDGSRFSKTGFMIHFDEAVANVGAEVVRYLFASVPPGTKVRFGYGLTGGARRRLMSLWNVSRFFSTYARLDHPDLRRRPTPDDLRIIDRWLVARTNALLGAVTGALDRYSTAEAILEIELYLEDLSDWYVRLNRRRFWKNENEADKTTAYWCLNQALRTVTQALAPICPFVTEAVWQAAVRPFDSDAALSVHLTSWPEPLPIPDDRGLLAATVLVRKLTSAALELRNQERLKVRQPLGALHVVTSDPAVAAAVETMRDLIADEVNVRTVNVAADRAVLERSVLSVNLAAAGPVLRSRVPALVDLLGRMDVAATQTAVEALRAGQPVHLDGWPEPVAPDFLAEKAEPRPDLVLTSGNGWTVGLDTRLTRELTLEGTARDLIRHIQVLRKEAGLEVDQRIALGLETADELVRDAAREHADHIRAETLALNLSPATLPDPVIARLVDIGEAQVSISLAPVAGQSE